MNKTQWYEVFVYEGIEKGTRTVAQFDNAQQARDYIKNIGNKENYHIDKWTDKENPTRLAGLE